MNTTFPTRLSHQEGPARYAHHHVISREIFLHEQGLLLKEIKCNNYIDILQFLKIIVNMLLNGSSVPVSRNGAGKTEKQVCVFLNLRE